MRLAWQNNMAPKCMDLHVRFPATYPIVGPEAMPVVLEAAEEQAKFEAKQMHEMLETVPHEVTVTEGDLWPALSEIVNKQKTDLIVMGTHGRTGVSRALLGSAAEEIFRKASCPVLTVGPHVSRNTERRLAMKEILFATDFSPESLAALPFAVSLAQEHQSNLTLLNVAGKPEVGELVHAGQYAESTHAAAASTGAGGGRTVVRAEVQGRARAGGGENHGGGHCSWRRPDRPRRARSARRSWRHNAFAAVHRASGGYKRSMPGPDRACVTDSRGGYGPSADRGGSARG